MGRWKVPTEEVFIGDSTYQLKLVPKDIIEGNCGLFDGTDQILYVSRDQPKLGGIRTFIHEWVHAQLYERGVPDLPPGLEEMICSIMENAVIQLMKDDQLVRWIRTAAKASQRKTEECQKARKQRKALKKPPK